MPLVTVIIPIYNVQDYLARCVHSVCAQSHRNLEIILVDDGSTDRSSIMCKRYAEEDDRIKVVRKRNGGLSSARNAGLKVMTGDYVTFVDGDDYIHPQFVERLLALLTGSNAQVAVCAWQELNEGDTPQPVKECYKTAVYTGQEALENMLYQRRGLTHSACSRLFDAHIFSELRFMPGVLYEDLELIYPIMSQVQTLAHTAAPMYYYMHRPGSIITTVSVKRAQILDHLLALRLQVTTQNPELLPAVQARQLSASLNMLRIMPPGAPEWNVLRQRSEYNIRTLRWQCLRNPKVRLRDKAACLISYLSMPLLFRLINNR